MIRILVIDDDSGHRLILENRLTGKGCNVVSADSGAKGLVEARGGAFELIIVAARLGAGIDGLEVTRRLRSIPETNAIPVILYDTHSGAAELAERAYDAGCDHYLHGQELHGLEYVIRLLVRQRRQRLDLAEQLRASQEIARRAGGERPREADPQVRENGEHSNVLRELAAGRPDGVLLVDGEGTVRHADRGACELLGARLEDRHLGSLFPATGLEAFVRDARTEVREGFRFEINSRRSRASRVLTAIVVPFMLTSGAGADPGLRVVMLQDAAKRRLAADLLRLPERGIPISELGPLTEAARECYRVDRLVGETPAMHALREAVAAACQASGPVLILGPNGSGKERIARTLHFSGTANGAFQHLRCAALANGDVELELFGYAKGAFPGAMQDRNGLFQLAQDGTLYLEDVGCLPLAAQERIAHFLENHTLVRAGSRRAERFDVRVIASSSQPLEELVAARKCAPELARLLGETVLRAPALSERLSDVPLIAAEAVRRFGGIHGTREIGDDALDVLLRHDWKDDLEGLESVLMRACSRVDGPTLHAEHLPLSLGERGVDLPARDLIPTPRPRGPQQPGTHLVSGPAANQPSLPSHLASGSTELRPWDITEQDPVSLDLYEKKALLRALDQVGGDKLAAARLLKVGKSTLYRKLKRFGIH